MASDSSTNLQLPYLAAGQAQKHVTVNESLTKLDALVQLSVKSATTSAEPGSPSDGEVYILPSGKTGTYWGAMSNYAVAHYVDGAWSTYAPREGWFAWIKDTDRVVVFDGSAWVDVGAGGSFAFTGDVTPAQTTSDQNDYNVAGSAASVLRLSSDATRTITGLAGGADGRILFIANVGSYDIILSNADAGSSAANRFAFAASVELPPNAACKLLYDATSARWRLISLATPRCVYDEFTASGAWTKRAGAVRVDVEAIGGGGGGGGGARVASGTACSGGGGGGGSIRVAAFLTPVNITSTVTVTVATGGAPGAGATSNGAAGGNAGQGGTSSFGAYVQAPGAGGGAGGQIAGASGGGGGAGTATAGSNSSSGTGGTGGTPGGIAGGSGVAATNSQSAGAGGGGGASGGAGTAGGSACQGPSGGGAGGGIAASPANTSGGAGGYAYGTYTQATGGSSAAGGSPPSSVTPAGGGGGGGGSNASGVGYAGANGGAYGGGAGGGGAGLSANGGAGGTGGAGLVRVWTFF
ncbi:MAG: DUF2793 domain-containing protein [Alphaproteobacteria bacterium]